MMRKISLGAALLAVAGFGLAAAPTASADDVGATATCADAFRGATSGHVYAYDGTNCNGFLGKTESWDSNWGNSVGPFQGNDTNRASSVLNKGTSGMAVQFFNGTGQDWGGGHSCLSRNEAWVTNLSRNYFTSGYNVNNAISSHRWVWNSSCSAFMR